MAADIQKRITLAFSNVFALIVCISIKNIFCPIRQKWYLMLVTRKFCGKKFFKKSKMAAKIKKSILSAILDFLANFFSQNWRVTNIK
jgi:hypothetical protein